MPPRPGGVQANDVDDADLLDLQVGPGSWRYGCVRNGRTTPRAAARGRRYAGARPARRCRLLDGLAEPVRTAGGLKSIRAVIGSMFPPVTTTPKSRHTTPHRTCSPEWVRISAVRRSSSTAPRTVVPGSWYGSPSAGIRYRSSPFRTPFNPGLHAGPEQDAVDPAAARHPRGRTLSGPARYRRAHRPAARTRAPRRPTRAASDHPVQAGASAIACQPPEQNTAQAGPDQELTAVVPGVLRLAEAALRLF